MPLTIHTKHIHRGVTVILDLSPIDVSFAREFYAKMLQRPEISLQVQAKHHCE